MLGAETVGNLPDLRSRLVPQLKTLLSGDLSPLLSRLPPQTRFSGNVSAHRVFEAVGLPFAELQAVRRQAGTGTINDLFLCIVGGALNRYLGDKGELPDSSMVAMVPMTLRGEEKGGDRGNQVGFTLMPVHSDIAEPLERLRAINQSAQTSKRVTDAVGKELARDLLEYLPAPVSGMLLRNVKLPGIGLIVSNVRGPDAPLYMAGAQLVNYSPISIPIDGMGLNVTGFSCAGTMWICAVSCREMMPDPAFFAECLRSSFEELKQAAARHADAIEAAAEAAVARPGKARSVAGKRPAKRAAAKAPTPARKRAAQPRRKAAAAERD
jgi:WS/DGAT/MGAT family acyltransferase